MDNIYTKTKCQVLPRNPKYERVRTTCERRWPGSPVFLTAFRTEPQTTHRNLWVSVEGLRKAPIRLNPWSKAMEPGHSRYGQRSRLKKTKGSTLHNEEHLWNRIQTEQNRKNRDEVDPEIWQKWHQTKGTTDHWYKNKSGRQNTAAYLKNEHIVTKWGSLQKCHNPATNCGETLRLSLQS